MSQKFGFACNDGDAPGGGRREEDGQAADVLIGINRLYEITPKQLLIDNKMLWEIFKNQYQHKHVGARFLGTRAYLLVVPQESHSTYLNIYIMPVDAIKRKRTETRDKNITVKNTEP